MLLAWFWNGREQVLVERQDKQLLQKDLLAVKTDLENSKKGKKMPTGSSGSSYEEEEVFYNRAKLA